VAQKVQRKGPGNYMFPEHLYYRYFDFKYPKQKHCWSPDDLRTLCIGTELYLMYLQTAGLIEVLNDSIEIDPFGRGGSARLIQCAVVRGYRRANYSVAQGQLSGKMTRQLVCHGTHAMSLASILEAGGPKGSREDEHDCAVPGLYTCPDGELSALDYGTRARLIMDLTETYAEDVCP